MAKQHDVYDANFKCGLCQELESTEPTGVGYICSVCDIEFDVPSKLEDHISTHVMTKAY